MQCPCCTINGMGGALAGPVQLYTSGRQFASLPVHQEFLLSLLTERHSPRGDNYIRKIVLIKFNIVLIKFNKDREDGVYGWARGTILGIPQKMNRWFSTQLWRSRRDLRSGVAHDEDEPLDVLISKPHERQQYLATGAVPAGV